LLYVGYSRIGIKFVRTFRKSRFNAKTAKDVGFGIRMYVDYMDPNTWNLALGKDNEEKSKKIFLEYVKKSGTIIDVGAHIGDYSLIAAKKIGPKGKVIAIEPFIDAVTRIKENFSLNNLDNYEVLQVAVGEKQEKRQLYENDITGAGYLDPIEDIVKNDLSSKSEILVSTIDAIIAKERIKKVDIMKIDVDGFEYEVLLGCKKSFSEKKIMNILCEVHHGYLMKKGIDEEKIYSLLKENGFNMRYLGKVRSRVGHILATT